MSSNSLVRYITEDFEGAKLTFYNFDGRLCAIAVDMGIVLDYGKDGRALPDLIGDEWKKEFKRGHHFDVLEGDKLRKFKEIAKDAGRNLASHARLMVLYQPGVDLVCLKTEKPVGERLRAFVVDKVMPKLRSGEPILPPGTVALTEERIVELVAATVKETIKQLERHREQQPLTGTIGQVGGAEIRQKIRMYGDLMAGPGNRATARKWSSSGDVELRSRLAFTGAGSSWNELPFEKLGPARQILTEMIRRASMVAGERAQTDLPGIK